VENQKLNKIMKKLLLIFAIGFISLSGKVEPRFNLNTIVWYGDRPHQGICLKHRTIWEISSTLYQLTDPAQGLSPYKQKMYWKIYNKEGAFGSGTWKKGMKPIRFGYTPVKIKVNDH